jgi:hypothetical protein
VGLYFFDKLSLIRQTTFDLHRSLKVSSDKNKVVRYTGSNPSQRGDIKYWDGNNWVSLQIGLTGDILTAHGIGVPPSWEGQSILSSSSSSSSSSLVLSSSSSSFVDPEPPPNLPSVPFDQPTGLTSQTNSLAREEVHLVMQPKGATSTKDRQGNIYENVEGPFAAPWNWDDNNSGNELLYFGFEDPLTNKYIGVSYTQTQYSTFGYYISEIRVKTYEISGDNTGGSTLSGGPRNYTIESDGVFDITCDSNGDITGSLIGISLTSSSSSSSITSVDFTLPPPESDPPIVPDPPNKLTIDIPLFTLEISRFPGGGFNSYSMNLVPKPTYMQESAYAGGKIGGLWYELMEKIRDYGDNGGYVSQTGVPVTTLNSSSSNVVVGCWGWYGKESSSSSAPLEMPPHFIPVNRISDDFNIDINEFIGTDARLGFEAANVVENVSSYVSAISFFDVNVIATIWNLIQDPNSKGYWSLNWCDPSLRINGDTVCCLSGNPVPAIQVTVTADDADLPVTWCGITWEKSTTSITNPETQRKSGQSAKVCPAVYIKNKQFTSNITSFFYGPFGDRWFAANRWIIANNLSLSRSYEIRAPRTGDGGAFTGNLYPYGIYNRLTVKGSIDRIAWSGQNPPATERPISLDGFGASYLIGKLALSLNNVLEPQPTYNDYLLTDEYFGSHTTGGVTYTWIKGNGWDSF